MISTLLHLLRLCPFLRGGHRQLALETLALRQPLTGYQMAARPPLRSRDRLVSVWLSTVWIRIVREAPDEQPIGGPQAWTRRAAPEDDQLLPQREVLENQGALGPDPARRDR